MPSQLKQTLEHAATRYDRAQSSKRGYNIYALGQYLQRVDDVVAEVAAGKTVEAALRANFNDRLLDHLLKAIR